MPENSMLSIRPSYELATRYGSAWQGQIVNAAGGNVVDLYGDNATGANFFSAIESQDPILVNIFGHGNYNIIAGQNDEVYLTGCQTDGVLAERVVYDLSCRAGRDLGASSVSKGAISFLGYNEDFMFVITEGEHQDGGMLNPLADETARGFFESHNVAPISYINGFGIEDSYWVSQENFNYWIAVWESIDSQVAGLLVWDRDHQVAHPFAGPRVRVGGISPLLIALVPLALIPLWKHLKKIKTL